MDQNGPGERENTRGGGTVTSQCGLQLHTTRPPGPQASLVNAPGADAAAGAGAAHPAAGAAGRRGEQLDEVLVRHLAVRIDVTFARSRASRCLGVGAQAVEGALARQPAGRKRRAQQRPLVARGQRGPLLRIRSNMLSICSIVTPIDSCLRPVWNSVRDIFPSPFWSNALNACPPVHARTDDALRAGWPAGTRSCAHAPAHARARMREGARGAPC